MSHVFTLRTHSRVKTRSTCRYLSTHVNGTGTVYDMSLAGWRIVGNQHVAQGNTLSLQVFLSLTADSVEIERATVQWVKGREFGLRMIGLSPSAEAAIKAFLDRRIESAGPVQRKGYPNSRCNG